MKPRLFAATVGMYLSAIALVAAVQAPAEVTSVPSRQSALVPTMRKAGPGNAQAPTAAAQPSVDRALIDRYCVTCHNERLKTGNFTLDTADVNSIPDHAEVWEKVITKVRGGSMPPPGRPRPDASVLAGFASSVENAIDIAAASHPNPARPVLHRLNRSEYANAVRDLFGLQIDARTMLPADDSGFGFDNIGDVLSVSSGLMERYLSAGRAVARLAVGDTDIRPAVQTFKAPKNDRQEARVSEDAPFGTRGGITFQYLAPVHAEYALKVRLLRTVGDQDYLRGLHRLSLVDVRMDGDRLMQFKVGGQLGCPVQGLVGKGCFEQLSGPTVTLLPEEPDAFMFRIPLDGGQHAFTAAFAEQTLESEGVKPRYPTGHYSFQNEIEGYPFIDSVDVDGPYLAQPPSSTAPSRKRIFVCTPSSRADERACAKKILSGLVRHAYRHPATDSDVQTLLPFFESGRSGKRPFDAGIQAAIVRILVSPQFLFRAEQDPLTSKPGQAYKLGDIELASRLSFFLWSSIPDDELLGLAERGKLSEPATLDAQVRRMLDDERSLSITTNFAGQWLLLRNLQGIMPDTHEFPDFDDELRTAARRETELFFASQIRENRPVSELLSADYTFLNERLARHYGVLNVYGSHFRRVAVMDDRRKGLLGQASILTVTSYPNRTSPVLRGKWVLENILGSPPPAPPPNVPALEEQPATKYKSMRDRMDVHRKNPVCSTCHARIDPIGFAMENFDGIGQWRDGMGEGSIDVSGTFDGANFAGVSGLRSILLQHQEQFVASVTGKLMTYALGRGVQYTDMPAIRKILRDAKSDGYRWSSLFVGIVNSTSFTMRRSES